MRDLGNRTTIEHYSQRELLAKIEAVLAALDKSSQSISNHDLATADEFHIGGCVATQHWVQHLEFKAAQTVLDLGCGFGGARRYLASEFGVAVNVMT